MDANNPSANPTFATRTPLHIGAVALRVRDLDRVAGFYRDVIGLSELDRSANTVRLGAGDMALLELSRHPDAPPDDPRAAGLFHTAFLMPTRRDLARWILHLARNAVPITGASDHGVSEAFYLDDPEGNGVEVYADRPPQAWQHRDGMVEMPTKPLDIENIVAGVDPLSEAFAGAPGGLRVGHIHLRVGDLDQAERFYGQAIGLDLTRRRQGAAFLSSGGYHHHVGSNVWHSAGAGPREPDRAGLDWFSLQASNPATFEAVAAGLAASGAETRPFPGGLEAADPWGTRLRLLQPR
jgi:catechol 2,3-dioxygenase